MRVTAQLAFAITAAAGALLRPSGPFHVGFSQHVIQHNTTNDPTPGPGTGILAHLYYPTRDTKRPAHVPYFDAKGAIFWNELLQLPKGALLNLTTALKGNASFLQAPTGRPTILFSPGGGVNAWMYYGLLADFASHGYTVLAIDHPGEPPSLLWPNGTENIGWDIKMPYTPKLIKEIHAYRVADIKAVLSWLPSFVKKTKAPFELDRFISLGHSIGGSASAAVIPREPKVQAAVNLDGAFVGNSVVTTDVKRPVFLMSSINHTVQMDPTWTSFQDHQTAWWESVSIYNAAHLDYSDITTWNGALGFPSLERSEFGPTGGVRTAQIARKYVEDFLLWVEDRSNGKGVLDSPSLKWHEVVYVNGTDI